MLGLRARYSVVAIAVASFSTVVGGSCGDGDTHGSAGTAGDSTVSSTQGATGGGNVGGFGGGGAAGAGMGGSGTAGSVASGGAGGGIEPGMLDCSPPTGTLPPLKLTCSRDGGWTIPWT